MVKNDQKKINLRKDGNRPPPKMEIKLIRKINLRKDGNRPPKGGRFPSFLI